MWSQCQENPNSVNYRGPPCGNQGQGHWNNNNYQRQNNYGPPENGNPPRFFYQITIKAFLAVLEGRKVAMLMVTGTHKKMGSSSKTLKTPIFNKMAWLTIYTMVRQCLVKCLFRQLLSKLVQFQQQKQKQISIC
jgi:hypothetical protein